MLDPLFCLRLVLVVLGSARSTALEPYRPIFIGLTLLFLGFAFYRLYLAAPVCSARIGLRQSEVFETATGWHSGSLRSGAWPHCRSVVRTAVLLTMKSLINRLCLLSAAIAFPFSLLAGTSNRDS